MLKKYTEQDADSAFLKNKTVAVLGYGSQGKAQVCCLKDSGVRVIVGVRPGKSFDDAISDGQSVMSIADACAKADIIHVLLPDQIQGEIYKTEIKKYLSPKKTLSFSHGFSIVYKQIVPPENMDVIMVAPLAPGIEQRKLFLEKSGVPCLISTHQDASGSAKKTALALAKACGFLRIGGFECTFEQETHQDLFSEQVILCGGLVELIRAGYDTLIEAGYPPELAYFCLHETKLITHLLVEHGIEGMYARVSPTAEYGGRTVGPKIIDGHVKDRMKKILADVKDGSFAKEWISEFQNNAPELKKMRQQGSTHSIEALGEKMRRALNKKK